MEKVTQHPFLLCLRVPPKLPTYHLLEIKMENTMYEHKSHHKMIFSVDLFTFYKGKKYEFFRIYWNMDNVLEYSRPDFMYSISYSIIFFTIMDCVIFF